MSIKRTLITTIVALALVATVVPGVAQGVTIDELLAQIAQLQAQLTSLSGSTTTTSTSSYSACAGVTFSRNLTVGATGSDVKCLQQVLNGNGFTVATTGAGSPGAETTYFGSRTLVAVKAYQAAKGLIPANQVGPQTRALLNAAIAGTSTGTGTGTGTGTVVTTGPVSATLSSDTPASGAVLASQATADLLHINFTGSGTVTSVTFQRSGISDQNTLTNVYLYDGATRLTDGYSFNSTGTFTMNGLSIPVNGSKVISVKADTAASGVVGSSGSNPASSIAVTLTGYVANGTTSSASVTGNTMSIVSGSAATTTLAAMSMAATATINAGTSQYTFWTDTLQVNTRSVLLKGANFKMIGSAPSDALGNIKLFIDGVDTGKVGTIGTIQGSNYIMFDLASSPVTLTTGSHTVDVRADVQKGTNRTVQLSLQQAADLTLTDTQVGVNIAVTTAGATTYTAKSGTTVTINYGTVTTTVDSTFTSYTNITSGATNAVIGKYTVHAYGEDVKVSSIVVTPLIKSATTTGSTCSTDASGTTVTGACGLNNVALYFNGSQVGSSVNWTHAQMAAATDITFQLGSQMIIPAGQDSTIEIRADLQTAGNVAYTGGTVSVSLPTGSSNAYGQSSQFTVNVPTAAVTTSGLSISSASLVVSKNPSLASYTASPNTTGVKIGSFSVQNQSTSESVRLTTLTVALTSNGTTALTATELSGLSALRTSDTTGSGSTPVQPAASNTFSVNDTLAPGASMTIDIYANVGSSSLISAVVAKLTVASIGATSNISSAGTAQTGQTVGFGTGTITNAPTLVASSTTPAQYIAAAGGAQKAAQATFSFVSTSGASTINELKFDVSGTDATPTQTVTQVCVGSVCAQPVNGSVDLLGLSLVVPNGGSGLQQAAQISYADVGTSGVIPGKTSTLGLSYIKYVTGGTTKTLGTATACTAAIGTTCTATLTDAVASSSVTLVGSKPTVVVSAGGGTGMILNQETKAGEVVVTADAKGAIKVGTIVFAMGYSGFSTNPTSMTGRLADASGNTISGISCSPSTTVSFSCAADTDNYGGHFTIAAGQSQTFTLYVTTSGAANTGTNKAQISSSLTKGSFKWDDTSYNGVDSAGVDLTGTLLYGFPTNAYSVSQ